MNVNIEKRRTVSVMPAVNTSNKWFTQHQKKLQTIQTKRSSRQPSSYYYQTMPINPENNATKYQKQPQRMRRTYSAFRNTQSKLSIIKDEVSQVSRQVRYLEENTKRTKLQISVMKKQLNNQLIERQTQLKQSVKKLLKLVKLDANEKNIRNQGIKNDIQSLKQNYSMIKGKVYQMQGRLTAVQNQCGFINFSSRLYK